MRFWDESVRIFNAIREHGTQSIRRLAERTGRSKSSVPRHLQAMARRDRSPESWLWETPEGRNWLIRLIVATLWMCGRKRGVGAETRREFFGRLPLEAPLGCAPSAYRTHLANLSLLLHPWCLVDATRHTSHEVERQRQAAVAALAMVSATQGVPVQKTALATVRKPLVGIAALVDVWWQTIEHDVEPMVLPPRWKPWVDELLLPRMYGQAQLPRTRCPGQKAQIALTLKAMQDPFERHPCPQRRAPDVLAGWQAWAAEHARAFQRASAAVEGRNGSWSQMQHNHRGVPTRR